MGKQRIKKAFIGVFLLLSSPSFTVWAEWVRPKEIIIGKWGPAVGEFYFEAQDTADSFPHKFGVDKNNNLIISDEGNRRIYVYKQNEKLLSVLRKPLELPESDIVFGLWPIEMELFGYNNTIAFRCDHKQIMDGYHSITTCLMSYDGKITLKIELAETYSSVDGYFLKKGNSYSHYLYSGKLLKTYDTWPLELGIVKERSLGNKKYESTVEYPDHTYKVNTAIGKYSRDMFANFYDILYAAKRFENEAEPVICYTVIRVDRCTGEEYVFEPPRSEYAGYKPEEINFPATRQEIKIEYGEPIVSPLGDLYCWARTKTHYKILKWTWQGPEDAPQSLQISAGLSGLKLNWEKPVKDKETVTGYQILRSSEVCGPFNEVVTLKKDKLAFEDQTIKPPWKYYYVVKAVRDKKFSGDSNKVYMQWK